MNMRHDVEIDQVFCGKIASLTLDEEETPNSVFYHFSSPLYVVAEAADRWRNGWSTPHQMRLQI